MKKLYTLLLIIIITTATCFSQNYKVIVNSKNPISTITKKELSQIFYKKKKNWPDGQTIEPVDLTASSSVRSEFTNDIHGKSVAAIRNYWQQAAFTGAGIAPLEKVSDDQVIEYIKNHPGAIGYISGKTNSSDIKVLFVQQLP